jgi:hypothetical protein
VRSADLVEYHRLVDRSPDEFIRLWDPTTNRILLTERVDPPELPLTLTSGASLGIGISGLDPAKESFLRSALDQIVPAGALSILSRSKTTIAFASAIGETSPTARALFGDLGLAELTCPDLGRYWPFLREAMIPLVPETIVSPEALLSIVVHELMHALDWALGEPGKRWSDSTEWKDLFAAAELFPNERSMQDPGELFAECAAIYLLGRHVDVQPLRDQVTTRTDLLRACPAIYQRLEQLFAGEIPALDRSGCRLPEATPRRVVEQALANAPEHQHSAWSRILEVIGR